MSPGETLLPAGRTGVGVSASGGVVTSIGVAPGVLTSGNWAFMASMAVSFLSSSFRSGDLVTSFIGSMTRL